MKCNKCGYDDSGSGDMAHACFSATSDARLMEMPEQEPDDLYIAYMSGLHRGKELAQRQWVGLTDLDLQEIIGTSVTMGEFIKNTEAKLKENNK